MGDKRTFFLLVRKNTHRINDILSFSSIRPLVHLSIYCLWSILKLSKRYTVFPTHLSYLWHILHWEFTFDNLNTTIYVHLALPCFVLLYNRDVDFDSLASGRIIPPWTPCVLGSIDTSQFDLEFTSMLPIGKKDEWVGEIKYAPSTVCSTLYCTIQITTRR